MANQKAKAINPRPRRMKIVSLVMANTFTVFWLGYYSGFVFPVFF